MRHVKLSGYIRNTWVHGYIMNILSVSGQLLNISEQWKSWPYHLYNQKSADLTQRGNKTCHILIYNHCVCISRLMGYGLFNVYEASIHQNLYYMTWPSIAAIFSATILHITLICLESRPS